MVQSLNYLNTNTANLSLCEIRCECKRIQFKSEGMFLYIPLQNIIMKLYEAQNCSSILLGVLQHIDLLHITVYKCLPYDMSLFILVGLLTHGICQHNVYYNFFWVLCNLQTGL